MPPLSPMARLRTGVRVWLAPALLLVLLLSAPGCGRKSEPAPPIAPAATAAAMQQAFASASTDLANQAQAVAAAAQQQDPMVVPVLLELSARPDLTAEQRAAASGCLQGLLEEARRQSAQGNTSAEAVLQAYRASK